MKKKGGRATTRTRRSSMAELLETPSPAVSPSEKSPKPDIFSDSSKHKKTVAIGSSTSALFNSPAHTPSQTVSSVSDLKDMASSRLDDLKRHIDRSHSEIFKDLDAFNTRLHKRFKIQNEACQQVSGETEKEYKKTSERIAESREAMMSSYAEFMADAQTTATHACKTSITKLSQSFEKAIDGLQSRYGTSSS